MKVKFLILCLFASAGLFAQRVQQHISIAPLTGNYYICTSYGYPGKNNDPFPANSLFVVTDAGIVLIDTPWDEPQTQQLIDSLNNRFHKKIVLCISTHFHDDRTAGLDVLKKNGTKTYTSQLTAELGKKHNGKTPEFTFSKDTTFTVGGLTLKTFYPGEGHTKDNIVVWFPDDLVLFGGCLIKSLDTEDKGYLKDANLKQWPATVENVIRYYAQAKYVIPGHQSWAGGVEELSHTLDVLHK